MAPLPDNDKTPDKSRQDKDKASAKEAQKDENEVSDLNDRELKALLDEAMNYKNPKDREGKSELFNDLLLKAEETERIARATSASGSEQVRHCNPAARRHRHTGGPRGRRYVGPSTSGLMGRSVSERGTHGGSLDNLAKEELYDATCRRLRGGRKSSTSSSGVSSYGCNQVRVSARQREGGSLPSNVNSGDTSRDFLEEAKRSKELRQDKEYVVVDMEKERLLETDLLPRGYEERLIDGGGSSRASSSASGPGETHMTSTAIIPAKYTSKATLQIQQSNRASNVDDPIQFGGVQLLDGVAVTSDDRRMCLEDVTKAVQPSKVQVIFPNHPAGKPPNLEEKKTDENGNALQQTKEKKKKKQTDKNVVVFKAESIAGHKSEIIDNVEELLQFIEGPKDNNIKSRTPQTKSKQLHKQHNSEDGGAKPKKRHTKSGSKELSAGGPEDGRHELKKSNSLGEISGMKLDREFEGFGKNKKDTEDENVVLRTNKPAIDRARERRSWGNVEPHSFQGLYNASSMENLETATDNWEVTRPKKKSKKRRNSVSSARQTSSNSGMSSSVSNEDRRTRRAPTPDLGAPSNAKITRSMPHSEKSNDSSDVDSVHSLPIDGPISYADIAKNSEKKKPSPEKQERSPQSSKERSPQPTAKSPQESDAKIATPPAVTVQQQDKPIPTTPAVSSSNNPINKTSVPDVNNIKSFPAITGIVTKTSVTATVSLQTSDKAVQSILSYEETFVREKAPLKAVVSAPLSSSSTDSNKEKRNKVGGSLNEPPGSVQGFFQVGDQLHGEMSFFSQLMRDSAHYVTAQRMPPDIVDVSTIEKIQLMNCSGLSGSPPQSSIPNAASTPSTDASSPQQSGTKTKRKKPATNGGYTPKGLNNSKNYSGDSVAPTVCDTTTNMEEEDEISKLVNGLPEEDLSSDPNSPPPVVILSGVSKEVPSGLVFGFDINEQLLLEDSSCQMLDNVVVRDNDITQTSIEDHLQNRGVDEWIKRYKPPPNDRGPPKHNHDKIVSFIATAWDNVVSQQIQYYSESL